MEQQRKNLIFLFGGAVLPKRVVTADVNLNIFKHDALVYGALIGESPDEIDLKWWADENGDNENNTINLFAPHSAIIFADIAKNEWSVRNITAPMLRMAVCRFENQDAQLLMAGNCSCLGSFNLDRAVRARTVAKGLAIAELPLCTHKWTIKYKWVQYFGIEGIGGWMDYHYKWEGQKYVDRILPKSKDTGVSVCYAKFGAKKTSNFVIRFTEYVWPEEAYDEPEKRCKDESIGEKTTLVHDNSELVLPAQISCVPQVNAIQVSPIGKDMKQKVINTKALVPFKCIDKCVEQNTNCPNPGMDVIAIQATCGPKPKKLQASPISQSIELHMIGLHQKGLKKINEHCQMNVSLDINKILTSICQGFLNRQHDVPTINEGQMVPWNIGSDSMTVIASPKLGHQALFPTSISSFAASVKVITFQQQRFTEVKIRVANEWNQEKTLSVYLGRGMIFVQINCGTQRKRIQASTIISPVEQVITHMPFSQNCESCLPNVLLDIKSMFTSIAQAFINSRQDGVKGIGKGQIVPLNFDSRIAAIAAPKLAHRECSLDRKIFSTAMPSIAASVKGVSFQQQNLTENQISKKLVLAPTAQLMNKSVASRIPSVHYLRETATSKSQSMAATRKQLPLKRVGCNISASKSSMRVPGKDFLKKELINSVSYKPVMLNQYRIVHKQMRKELDIPSVKLVKSEGQKDIASTKQFETSAMKTYAVVTKNVPAESLITTGTDNLLHDITEHYGDEELTPENQPDIGFENNSEFAENVPKKHGLLCRMRSFFRKTFQRKPGRKCCIFSCIKPRPQD